MKQGCRFILLLVIVAAGASCEKRPQAESTDDAKLRPELAAARKNASPTPMPNEAKPSPTPAP